MGALREFTNRSGVLNDEADRDLNVQTIKANLNRDFPGTDLGDRLPVISFSGYESNTLFRNRGDGTYDEIGVASGAGRREDGRSVAVADFDRDGRLDLVVANFLRRPLMLLRNQGTSDGAWLGVALRGTTSNRFGVGAKVTLQAGDRRWVQTLEAGSGFQSSDPAELHFGLGPVETVTLTVQWPTGCKQTIENVKTRGFVTVTEAEDLKWEAPKPTEVPEASAPPRPARAGDRLEALELKGPLGDTVQLPPEEGHVVLVLFSGGCMQCRGELSDADGFDARAGSLKEVEVVWASLDAEEEDVTGYFKFAKLDRTFVMVDGKTRGTLMGPGEPKLPTVFVVSKDRIEAKFIGQDAVTHALDWIGRGQ